MNTEIFNVGTYIDDEFWTFATCTNIEYANRAKELLEKHGGWEDIVIEKSNLYLNSIEIDGVEVDLTT